MAKTITNHEDDQDRRWLDDILYRFVGGDSARFSFINGKVFGPMLRDSERHCRIGKVTLK